MHPDPQRLRPIDNIENTVFLKPLLDTRDVRNITVGDYSYYSDFDDPTAFFERNVLYNFGMKDVELRFGKFCAIAHGTKFVMADANHAMEGPSTYPFPVFGGSWAEAMPVSEVPFLDKGSIEIGHDVWFGMEATVLPGVTIGNGAVIGTRAVVARDVPAYCVAVGNPATVVRQRYSDGDIERLTRLAWWDWDQELLADAIPLLVQGDVDDLERFADARGCLG